MNTIEEAAQEYADKKAKVFVSDTLIENTINDLNLFAKTDFKSGVEFAQQWINPNDQMPDVGELVQVKVEYEKGKFNYDHDKRIQNDNYDDFEIHQMVGLKVVGWRPINLK